MDTSHIVLLKSNRPGAVTMIDGTWYLSGSDSEDLQVTIDLMQLSQHGVLDASWNSKMSKAEHSLFLIMMEHVRSLTWVRRSCKRVDATLLRNLLVISQQCRLMDNGLFCWRVISSQKYPKATKFRTILRRKKRCLQNSVIRRDLAKEQDVVNNQELDHHKLPRT
jgi:hypothetical protein